MQKDLVVTNAHPLELQAKIEIDTQVATAKRYPRDVMRGIQDAGKLATITRDVAKKCIYCRPVGKGPNGRMKFAFGPSVRLTEIVQSQWGNLKIAARSLGVTDGILTVQGTYYDLEKNVQISREYSKSVRTRDGRDYSDTQIALTEGAAASIVMRNVVRAGIGEANLDIILEKVQVKIAGDNVEQSWKEAVAGFAAYGATEKDVLELIDAESVDEVGAEHLARLVGFYNLIKEEVCTAEDVFGKKLGEPVKPKGAGKGKGKGKAPKETPQPQQEEKGPVEEDPPSEQSPRQKFNTLNLQATTILGAEFVDELLAALVKQSDKLMTKWSDKELDSASNYLADAIASKE